MRLFIIIWIFVFNVLAIIAKEDVNIVFVGNSITFGDQLKDRLHEAPPFVVKAIWESEKNSSKIEIANLGVCGATTVDYLPKENKLFNNVTKAGDQFAAQNGKLIFSIMLGTNDSAIKGPNGSPVSKESYKENMQTIIDEILNRYPTAHILVHHPLWYSPNTHNGALYLQEGLDRLESYLPQIDLLVKEYHQKGIDRVHRGDVKGFKQFKKHQEWLTAEQGYSGTFYLHPNKTGAQQLAKMWIKQIEKLCK